MRKRWLLSVGICLLRVSLCAAQHTTGQTDDNLILAMVLEKVFGGRGGFTVVSPKTFFATDMAPYGYVNERTKAHEKMKEQMKEHFSKEGYSIGPLVDLLFERNRRPVKLSLKSCPQNGYFIDYHEKYDKYFKGNGGGWKKLRKENPKARGQTQISLPAYDPDLHILLIYYGTVADRLAGEGCVVAYRYENDQLNELSRIVIWIS